MPLRIGHVMVAVAGRGAAAPPGTIHQVTYRGRASFWIPARAQLLSDPAAMRVWPQQDLVVSIYLPDQTGPATFHSDAQQVNWVSAAGDQAGDPDGSAPTIATPSWYYLSDLVVRSSAAVGTVVALGDSITDGAGSDAGGYRRAKPPVTLKTRPWPMPST